MTQPDKLTSGEELRLRVYDKLWENIIHKENRLWTFLAIYGAAVGFIVAQDTENLREFRDPAYFVLLLLTYWAAEIIIDSEWWSVRNRLMVQGIEKVHQEALKGVIPTFYNDVGYHGESLHGASIVIVCAVGLSAYFVALHNIVAEENWVAAATWAGILYLTAGLALMRCMHMRERRLMDYYSVFRNLNEQTKAFQEDRVGEQQRVDIRKLTWRRWVGLVYMVVVVVTFGCSWGVMSQASSWAFGIAQFLILSIGVSQYGEYVEVRKGCVGMSPFYERPARAGADSLVAEWYACRNRWMLVLFFISAGLLWWSIATRSAPATWLP
jgi:hypothetical protein